MCIHTVFLSIAFSHSLTPTQAHAHTHTPKAQLSVSEAGRIPHVCVQKQHRCSQGHRGRNMPAGLWTWSWEESRLPFLSNKLNCYASELQRSNWPGGTPFTYWLQAFAPSSLAFSLRTSQQWVRSAAVCHRLFSSRSLPDVKVDFF